MTIARKYFGTDGIRGTFGDAVMNPGFARSVGVALGRWIKSRADTTFETCVLIGRDTRSSGTELTQALAEGLAVEDITVRDAGVVPTPAIALAMRGAGATLGIAVTASHNPSADNGIKVFDSAALKLTDAEELEIENLIDEIQKADIEYPEVELEPFDAMESYVDVMKGMMAGRSLSGWIIACDLANGATAETTPHVLRELGATVHCIGDHPNGQNINDGVGSEYPENLQALVRETGARIGIGHDGDGDRVLICDETGSRLVGDEVLALLAVQLLRTGRLAKETLVVTVMSNLGIEQVMSGVGGRVERVNVGDRYVLEAMLDHGYNFGGETSGHIIFKDLSTTGDGLLAALLVIQVMQDRAALLSELRKVMQFFPQRKKNINVREKIPFESIPGFQEALADIEKALGGKGRILVRYSGTEPKIRLLTEAEDDASADAALSRIEDLIRTHLEVV